MKRGKTQVLSLTASLFHRHCEVSVGLLVTAEQGCKSLFEVGEAILWEGTYFIIFGGAYATFSPT